MNPSQKNRGFKFSAGGNLLLDKNLTAKLALPKAHSLCHDCGALGHWKGDPQCPKRGQGKSGPSSSSKWVAKAQGSTKTKSAASRFLRKAIALDMTFTGFLTGAVSTEIRLTAIPKDCFRP